MVKSKLALIFDSLFISSLSTFLLFIWLHNKVKNANLFHFFLNLINLSLFALVLVLFLKLHNKKLFKANNEKQLNSSIDFLIQCDYKTYSSFLTKLIGCEKITDYFYKFGSNFLYINIKTPLSSKDYFDAQELFFNNKTSDSKLYFIIISTNKSFDDIAKISKLNFSILPLNTLANLMQKKNIFPITEDKIAKTSLKQKIKSTIKTKTSAITKSHFKEIFLTSISLLFLSLVVPFSSYYLISGTILLIISIVSLFKKDIPTSNNDTDIFS